MHIFRILLAMFALMLVATSSANAATLVRDKDRLVLMHNDKKIILPDDLGKLKSMYHPVIEYAIFNKDNESVKKYGITPGIYIVGGTELLMYFRGVLPPKTRGNWDEGLKAVDFGSEVFDASLSPNGAFLALALDATMSPTWVFFTMPGMKYINGGMITAYYDGETDKPLYWHSNSSVLFDEMGSTKRKCQYDPCGNISIKSIDILNGKITIVKQGTDLCDYRMLSVDDSEGEGGIAKICMKSVSDWKHYPGMKNAVKDGIRLP